MLIDILYRHQREEYIEKQHDNKLYIHAESTSLDHQHGA